MSTGHSPSRSRAGKYLAVPVLAVALLGGWRLMLLRRHQSPAPPQCSHIRVPVDSWGVPSCARPQGEVPVTFSCDQGRTLVPVAPAGPASAVSSILALDEPGGLMTLYRGDLFRSRDAGCTWSRIERNERYGFQTWPKLIKGAGGRVYGFQLYSHDPFVIDGDRFKRIQRPGNQVQGLGADRRNPAHLRAADESGQLRDSIDSGEHWRPVGNPPPYGSSSPLVKTPRPLLVSVQFDPSDLNHVFFTAGDESHVTKDGGASWIRVVVPGRMYLVDISPVDGSVVWASTDMGLLRSSDGGETFVPYTGWSFQPFRRPLWIKADPANPNAAFAYMAGLTPEGNFHYVDIARNLHEVRTVEWSVFEASPATPELWYVGLVGELLPVQ